MVCSSCMGTLLHAHFSSVHASAHPATSLGSLQTPRDDHCSFTSVFLSPRVWETETPWHSSSHLAAGNFCSSPLLVLRRQPWGCSAFPLPGAGAAGAACSCGTALQGDGMQGCRSNCCAFHMDLGKAEPAKREVKQTIINIICLLLLLSITKDTNPTSKYVMNKERQCEPWKLSVLLFRD